MTLLGLRLRAWLGWGQHPTYLRLQSDLATKAFILYALIFSLTPLALSALPYVTRYHSLPTRLPADGIRSVLYSETFIWLAGIFIFVLPIVTRRLLVRRSAASQIGRIYGRCFAVVLEPPDRMFARIGASREMAEWYSIPLEWDRLVAPSEDQLELDVLAATGWVERVRRFGSQAGELSCPAPTEDEVQSVPRSRPATPDEFREALEAQEELERELRTELERERRGEASKEERQQMRRYARRASVGAAQTPRMIAAGAWSFVLLGILLGTIWPVGYIVIVMLFPHSVRHSIRHSANNDIALAVIAIFTVVGICLIGYGVKLLRLSRRLRRLSPSPPDSVTGEIVCWMPYWDNFSSGSFQKRGETVIKLRAVDGNERIFRIPIRYLHRVRRRGAWVCVTYQPVAERVLDVAYAEEPVTASTGDEPERL